MGSTSQLWFNICVRVCCSSSATPLSCNGSPDRLRFGVHMLGDLPQCTISAQCTAHAVHRSSLLSRALMCTSARACRLLIRAVSRLMPAGWLLPKTPKCKNAEHLLLL